MPDSGLGKAEGTMSSGPLETEIKLRVNGAAEARSHLEQHGFTVSRDRVFEANAVYDTSDLKLRKQGQLLRLRATGDQTLLTWKGPELTGKHKSRPETEVGIDDFSQFTEILGHLGFEVSFRYEKFRTEFREASGDGIATLDETPIGNFLELEGAPEWIDRTAGTLGFTPDQYITASYGGLYLAYCLETGRKAAFMQFSAEF